MNLNLRQAICGRLVDKSREELFAVISGSVGSDERSLPGLGVIFEMIWNQCDTDTQNQLTSSLKTYLDQNVKSHVEGN